MEHSVTPISATAGHAPGTLVHVGQKYPTAIEIAVIEYDAGAAVRRQCAIAELVQECALARASSRVTWFDVSGIHDPAIVTAFGEQLGLHPLTREAIMNAAQRPKIEDFADYRFMAVKMLRTAPETGALVVEQVSLILGERYVLSFQERPGDVFEPLRGRLTGGTGIVRRHGADYLAYALIDAIVDNYFIVLESIGDRIDAIEEAVLDEPQDNALREIHELRRDLIHIRRAAWPLRELTSISQGTDAKLVGEDTQVYFRDIHDHVVQVLDLVETFRELVSSVRDHYLTAVSNRMNNVMKVLTVIGTIFLPLTFIAGVYGMNFANMPELAWPWGYAAVWAVMVVVAAVLVIAFRRRRWI